MSDEWTPLTALRELEDCVNGESDGYGTELAKMVVKGMPQWINVKHRLPEQGIKDLVLVATLDDEGDRSYSVEVWYYNRWEHLPAETNYDDHHKEEITHWMPITEPPK